MGLVINIAEGTEFVELITCKTALSRTGIPGHKYCLNPYTGCRHACLYCYAPTILRFSPVSPDWGRRVQAKVNVARVLKDEVRRKRSPIGNVLIGSVTDAYQPCEREMQLTRQCLEVLSQVPGTGVSILTKSSLVTRDIDLLVRWISPDHALQDVSGNPYLEGLEGIQDGGADDSGSRELSVGFSITALDEKVARVFEPGASSPSERLEAARVLVENEIPVWVFVAPVLPGITDTPKDLKDLLEAIKSAGVTSVSFDGLNPYPRSVSLLRPAYTRFFPEALPSLDRYLRDPRGYMGGFKIMVNSLVRGLGLEIDV